MFYPALTTLELSTKSLQYSLKYYFNQENFRDPESTYEIPQKRDLRIFSSLPALRIYIHLHFSTCDAH